MASAAGTAPVPTKKASRPARKTSGVSAKKTSAKAASAKPKSSGGAPKKATPAASTVSDEAIRMRAYFIAESRARSGHDGDSASDWMEARRQLLAEAAGEA
jgi:hypothetical protein